MSCKEWREFIFSDFVEINPVIKLDKRKEFSFVEMKDLSSTSKWARPTVKRKLTGGARFAENDTLFARITPCLENGKICQVVNLEKGVGFGSTEFLVFRGRVNKSDSDFVFYLSRWDVVRRFAEQNLVGTSGRQRVGKEAFNKLSLKLPPLNTQRRIASILSSLDDKIELNRQTNQTLEAIAQALFKEWFVDFNFPGSTGEMEDSELGEIPKGWNIGVIGDLFEISKESLNPSSRPTVGFIHYSLPAFDEGRRPTRELGSQILSNKFKVKSNSILVSKLNPRISRVWPIIESNDQSICSTEFQVFLPKRDYLFSFGSTLFSQNQIIETMKGRATGTSSSHQRIRPQDILDIKIVIPNNETLKGFNKAIKNFYNLIFINEEQMQTLIQLRDSFLPKLMRGEIEI
jgi:type I restriction enzyme, S subunit